eukprot:2237404-Prymnesium_polylepis.1
MLLTRDLCALECTCACLKDSPERAARAAVQQLTADVWPTGVSLGERGWKRELAFLTAFVEGRRGCLGAGEGHALLLSRRLRRLQPGGAVWRAAASDASIAGEYTESSSGSADNPSLMRLWEEGRALAPPTHASEVYGTYGRGTGELSGTVNRSDDPPTLSGRWSVHGEAAGDGSFRLRSSTASANDSIEHHLTGEADSVTGWRGEWRARRSAEYVGVREAFWAPQHPARLVSLGYNAYSQCCIIEFVRPPAGSNKRLPVIDVVAVSAGAHHSAALCENGVLFCIGLND